jgi:hypothetical protein
MYALEPSMILDAGLSKFILNWSVELMKSRVCYSQGLKERHMAKIVNDVLGFTGKVVLCSQMCNHLSKWREKWNVICKIKEQGELQLSNYSCCFMIDDDEKLQKHLTVR